MIQRLILLATVFLFGLPHAHADEASKRAKIQEMFTVLKMDALMKQMMNQGMAQGRETVKSMMGDTPLTAADQKIIDDSTAKMMAVISETLSWQKLEPVYIDLYASAYTEEEVDGILTFYKSPVGQTLLAKTSELSAKSNAIVKGRVQEVGPRMQEVMADLQKQLRAVHPETNK